MFVCFGDCTDDSDTKVPTLVIETQNAKKPRIVSLDLKKKSVTIGRDVSTDIVINDNRVSRAHARVEYTKTHCEYFDLGSTGGSMLNGVRIEHAVLMPGDEIRLGTSKFKLAVMEPKKTIGSYILNGFRSFTLGRNSLAPDVRSGGHMRAASASQGMAKDDTMREKPNKMTRHSLGV